MLKIFSRKKRQSFISFDKRKHVKKHIEKKVNIKRRGPELS